MADSPALLLIADIAGYTRFLKRHQTSLVHAQDIVARLLEAMIGAVQPALRLAKLEGDAAFFHAPAPLDEATLARHAAAIYHAFHACRADLRANTLCPCDGCQQVDGLKIKVVSHVGEIAVRRIAGMTELTGVAVILVHRMLKNDVPLPEYLLLTQPTLPLLDAAVRARADALTLDLEGLGPTPVFYIDLPALAGDPGPARKLPYLRRLARHLGLEFRSLPYFARVKQPCAGYRNVPDAPVETT
jgi:class 3 adenylate cyclase